MNLKNEPRVIKTNLVKKIYADGMTAEYDVYEIPLDLLFYNEFNDRVITYISNYSKEELQKMRLENKEKYNDLFEEVITNTNIPAMKKTKNNIDIVGQLEVGVVLKDGRIIDGNRRYTALRQLSKEGRAKRGFQAIILDFDYETNFKLIKQLELEIQIGKDEKLPYKAIDVLISIYELVCEREFSISEVAKWTGLSEKQINENIENAKLINELLFFINAKKQYHIARENDWLFPIVEINSLLKKAQSLNISNQELTMLKYSLFASLVVTSNGDKTRIFRNSYKKIIQTPEMICSFIQKSDDIVKKINEKANIHSDETNTLDVKEFFKSIILDNELNDKVTHVRNAMIEKFEILNSSNKMIENIEQVQRKIENLDSEMFRVLSVDEQQKMKSLITNVIEKLFDLKEKI
ncbi:hypothetical protein [[Mycoplasma] anseris]|uniref:ParB/Sulfiredoxin domain-containing protein n=1 Tax=[Mycoplasma] anseris TaxID=92400 RepID=A0A2Z4NE02_9BACT|nr:hypothetical protein [[Mycoplasma] anseris]AWX69635.1 hypothetical protein DP065_02680 [[Mycoplasma] anseris]